MNRRQKKITPKETYMAFMALAAQRRRREREVKQIEGNSDIQNHDRR